jgi:Putative enzyme of poly-gamma-glutamate biosynthesis (capsule formation)
LKVIFFLFFSLILGILHTQSYAQNGQDNCSNFVLYDTIEIAFIGDVMQHGIQIKRALKKNCNPLLASSYDYSNTFKYIEKELKSADLSVANMEFPLGDYPYGAYPNFKAPASIATQAKKSGIGLFLLANNHIFDQGQKGFQKTLSIYDTIGVPYLGAYYSEKEREKIEPAIIEINGVKFSFINFTYGSNIGPKNPFIINMMDSTYIKSSITKAKALGADIIIALPHWGEEYKLHPSQIQKKWASMLFWNGCDIIIGTHPHVPQVAEIVMDTLRNNLVKNIIFYSLGNYISNQSNPDYSQLGLLVNIRVIKNNLTQQVSIIKPEYEYLWCFKGGELEESHTVVPISYILNNKHIVRNKAQYDRMLRTYNYIKSNNLIKITELK